MSDTNANQKPNNVIPLFNYPVIILGASPRHNLLMAKLFNMPEAEDHEIKLTPRQVVLMERIRRRIRETPSATNNPIVQRLQILNESNHDE